MPRKKLTKTDEYLSKLLRHYRTVNGFSQKRLGDKLDVSFQQIQKYEKAKNQISVALFVEYCKILNLDPARVMQHITDIPTKPMIQNEGKHRSIVAINAKLQTMPDEKIEALKKLVDNF